MLAHAHVRVGLTRSPVLPLIWDPSDGRVGGGTGGGWGHARSPGSVAVCMAADRRAAILRGSCELSGCSAG